MKPTPKKLKTIGRREWVHLPQLESFGIEAKVDTGAYRSVLHCVSCEELERDGKRVLVTVFNLDGKGDKTIIFGSYSERMVRSSSGHAEMRYIVKTTIRLGKKSIRSEVSLTDRSDMRYQVLIGRKTLQGRYRVNVAGKFLLDKA
jgi:hypothetical protein